MKRIKYQSSIKIIVLLLLISSGCSDYLEIQPEAEVPAEEFFVNQEDAEAALWSCYGILSHWNHYGGQGYLSAVMVPSDDEICYGFGPLYAYETFTYGPNEFRVGFLYRSRYQAINLNNQLITNLPDISMNDNLRKTIEGEAKFLRALHYFELVRFFGGVPLVLSPISSGAGNVRAPVEEVYTQIETDLQYAIDHLPATWPESEAGRATRWAAMSLKAKIHMYQEEWTEVLSLTNDVINSSGHDLYDEDGLDSYYELFRVRNENNIESIFEIQSNTFEGNPDNINGGRQYGQVIGIEGGGFGGWANVVPTDELANAFDAAGDSIRKKATILYAGEVTPDGDTVTLNPDQVPTVSPARYCGKAYVPKSVNPTNPYLAVSQQNIRLIRFAEVLLMNAEAALETGSGDAATPLNRVRARVGLQPISSPTLEDIYTERRLELATEFNRFFDLIRTGEAPEVLGSLGFQAGKHELFPIPLQEIELTNGLLEQNPGW